MSESWRRWKSCVLLRDEFFFHLVSSPFFSGKRCTSPSNDFSSDPNRLCLKGKRMWVQKASLSESLSSYPFAYERRLSCKHHEQHLFAPLSGMDFKCRKLFIAENLHFNFKQKKKFPLDIWVPKVGVGYVVKITRLDFEKDEGYTFTTALLADHIFSYNRIVQRMYCSRGDLRSCFFSNHAGSVYYAHYSMWIHSLNPFWKDPKSR